MDQKFFGDSYDIVKRFWADLLRPDAPLYAWPEFIPEDLRVEYSRFTGIAMYSPSLNSGSNFSILNDPDTGIRLPGAKKQARTRGHATIEQVVNQLDSIGAKWSLTYDQGYHRSRLFSPDQQRALKLDALSSRGCFGFYYRSHACFLFSSRSKKDLDNLRKLLEDAGMPPRKIQTS